MTHTLLASLPEAKKRNCMGPCISIWDGIMIISGMIWCLEALIRRIVEIWVPYGYPNNHQRRKLWMGTHTMGHCLVCAWPACIPCYL